MKSQFSLKQLLNGLNEDLEGAYASGIQYLHHASILKDIGNEFALDLDHQSMIEFENAKVINQMIVSLGGIPTVEVTKRHISLDYTQMLKEDLQDEYGAVTRYLNRIKQLENMGMEHFCQNIKQIIKKKEKHIHKLKHLLISCDI